MDFENLLYRILLGYYYINIDNELIKVMCPTLSLRYQSHQYYLDLLEKYKFDNSFISNDYKNQLLLINNIWNNSDDTELVIMNKSLDNAKVELYNNFYNPKFKNQIKHTIAGLYHSISLLEYRKHYLDFLTLDFFCNSMKNQFLLKHSLYDSDNNLLISDMDSIDSRLLEKMLNEIHDNQITIDNIKDFAKSDIWRSYWDSKKDNIFNSSIDLTDDQRILINMSRLLDNIREHPDSPSSEIINDNDALDGWMIFQNQKQKQEKIDSSKPKKQDKLTNNNRSTLQEVFYMSSNAEEAKEIMKNNTDEVNKGIYSLQDTIKEKGSMEWHEVPFIKTKD